MSNTSFDCLPKRDNATLAKITDSPGELIQMADFINRSNDFKFVREHHARITLEGFHAGVLQIGLQGTSCNGCPALNVRTVGGLKFFLQKNFGVSPADVRVDVKANLAGPKANLAL
jgi:Fe-S cluster biogenesis protein NfuA